MAKVAKNGLARCPHCGASDISLDPVSGKLKCNFCRSLFVAEKINAAGGAEKLKGRIVSAGAQRIQADEKDVLTLRCPACGAEVMIDTGELTSARCHWCRHVLTINEKQPNGAVPDMVLPFKLTREEAMRKISAYVKDRRFFALPMFKKEFKVENVMGVYFPYMVVDVNAHSKFGGKGEHTTRSYVVKSGDSSEIRYDADLYKVEREFDLAVDDLTIESSEDRRDINTDLNTNNVINSIMPFDTENAVSWDARFLRGYASEKRDTDVAELLNLTRLQVGDVARYNARNMVSFYDRGVCWTEEKVDIVGSLWKAAYLPVWLYSYMQVKSDGQKVMHYVAVNARTGETAGSIPVNKRRLFAVSALIEISSVSLIWALSSTAATEKEANDVGFFMLFALASGFAFYMIKMKAYRSLNKRHAHERDTRAVPSNERKLDERIKSESGLSSSSIGGRNENVVYGSLLNKSKKTKKL